MKLTNPSILACIAGLALGACAQQPVYTEPFVTAPPPALATPVTVQLRVSYTKDGKPDPKRAQEVQGALSDVLAAGNGFKPAAPGQGGDPLEIKVEDNAAGAKKSRLAGITASVGHLLVGGAEFTPQGRRSMRELAVEIRYTPASGAALDQDYGSPIVTITNNTQDPTDLVPLQDRKHGEVTLIANDLNLFMAELAKSQASVP